MCDGLDVKSEFQLEGVREMVRVANAFKTASAVRW